MQTITKNSHELTGGDIVRVYGALIQIESSYCLIWEKEKHNAVVVAEGKCLNKGTPECDIPDSYFDGANSDEWNCQGNKLRNWSVVI